MTDPKRLIEADDMGADLLASARGDSPSRGSRARAAAALGIGVGIAAMTAGGAASAPRPLPETTESSFAGSRPSKPW